MLADDSRAQDWGSLRYDASVVMRPALVALFLVWPSVSDQLQFIAGHLSLPREFELSDGRASWRDLSIQRSLQFLRS